MTDSIYLRDSMLAEAEAVGLRLRACVLEALQRAFGRVPTSHDLSVATGLEGVVSKRVIKVLRDGPGVEVLTHAPSVPNLRELAGALEERMQLGPLESFALRDAAGKFEKLLQAYGGSKGDLTKVLRNIQHTEATPQTDRTLRFGTLSEDGSLRDEGGEQYAHFAPLNPLQYDAATLASLLVAKADGGVIITWSGTHAEGLFERDPGVWTPAAMADLGRLCREVAPALRQAGVRWLLRPHCRHVLCDTQRCVSFLRTQVSASSVRESMGLALDSVSMLENSMLDGKGGGGATPTDYVVRAIRTLGPASDCVLLAGVEPSERPADGEDGFDSALPQRVAVSQGRVPLAPLAEAIASIRPFIGTLVVEGGDPSDQIEFLRAALAPGSSERSASTDYTTH